MLLENIIVLLFILFVSFHYGFNAEIQEIIVSTIESNPKVCGKYGAPKYELVIRDDDEDKCEFPDFISRLHVKKLTYDCYKIKDKCQELIFEAITDVDDDVDDEDDDEDVDYGDDDGDEEYYDDDEDYGDDDDGDDEYYDDEETDCLKPSDFGGFLADNMDICALPKVKFILGQECGKENCKPPNFACGLRNGGAKIKCVKVPKPCSNAFKKQQCGEMDSKKSYGETPAVDSAPTYFPAAPKPVQPVPLPLENGYGAQKACVDHSEHCCFWATTMECDKNPFWMRTNCPKACGTCACTELTALKCKVTLGACGPMPQAKVSETMYPQITKPVAPFSLYSLQSASIASSEQINGLSKANGCSDKSIHCKYWAGNGECDKNPFWMEPNCQKSCNTCGKTIGDVNRPQETPGCSNNHESCQFWQTLGYCETNVKWMKRNCRLSCGTC